MEQKRCDFREILSEKRALSYWLRPEHAPYGRWQEEGLFPYCQAALAAFLSGEEGKTAVFWEDEVEDGVRQLLCREFAAARITALGKETAERCLSAEAAGRFLLQEAGGQPVLTHTDAERGSERKALSNYLSMQYRRQVRDMQGHKFERKAFSNYLLMQYRKQACDMQGVCGTEAFFPTKKTYYEFLSASFGARERELDLDYGQLRDAFFLQLAEVKRIREGLCGLSALLLKAAGEETRLAGEKKALQERLAVLAEELAAERRQYGQRKEAEAQEKKRLCAVREEKEEKSKTERCLLEAFERADIAYTDRDKAGGVRTKEEKEELLLRRGKLWREWEQAKRASEEALQEEKKAEEMWRAADAHRQETKERLAKWRAHLDEGKERLNALSQEQERLKRQVKDAKEEAGRRGVCIVDEELLDALLAEEDEADAAPQTGLWESREYNAARRELFLLARELLEEALQPV